jgi:hypothetical protein
MMTDRNEAFKHNSCKKLAQLGKVIFAMTCQGRDRRSALLELEEQCDAAIIALMDQHRESAEQIAKALIQFRKLCVDNCCREWGARYKKIKADLMAIYNAQNAKFSSIIAETQLIDKEIKVLQMSALQSASAALDSADAFHRDVDIKRRPRTATHRLIRQTVQPILDRMAAAQAESNGRIRAMRAEHNTEITRGRREIALFLKDKLSKRREPFSAIRSHLATLELDVKALRDEHSQLVAAQEAFFRDCKARRQAVVEESREFARKIRGEMRTVRDQQRAQRRDMNSDLADLRQALKIAQIGHKAALDAVRQEDRSLQRQFKQYGEWHEGEMRRRNADSDADEEAMGRQFATEMKRRKDIGQLMTNSVADAEADMAHLIRRLKARIEESVDRVRVSGTVFKSRLGQHENEYSARLDRQKAELRERRRDRLDVLEAAAETQGRMNELAQRNQSQIVHDLGRKRQELSVSNKGQIQEKTMRNDRKAQEIQRADDARIQNQTRELVKAFQRRQTEKRTRISELTTKLQRELDYQRSILATASLNKLAELRNGLEGQEPLTKHCDDHELNVAKAKVKVDVAARQLSTMFDLHAKQLEALLTEIATVDKAKRQFARRKKTEAQAIDGDFELQIDAQQVTLRQAIDSIAKLYTSDENERGRNVIESVRKVREIQNHIADFLTRKRHELDFMTQLHEGTSRELKQKIQGLEACEREKEIENEIAGARGQFAGQLQEIEKRMKAKTEHVLQKMSDENARIEGQIQALENEMATQNSQFSDQVVGIQDELQKVKNDTRAEMGRIEAEFDAQRERMNREHELAVEKMNKRIAITKEQMKELLTQFNAEKASQIQKNWDELERRSQDFSERNSALYADHRAHNKSMNRTISELSQKEFDVKHKLLSPTVRPVDQKRIEILLEKAHSSDDVIDAAFEQFYGVIREAPKNAPAADSLRASRSFHGTAPRKVRRDSGASRVVTPVESKRRRPQFLVTPQCT